MLSKFKQFLLLISDIIILYGSLLLTLDLRYGPQQFASKISLHILPFSLIFIIWLIVFYINDLYESKTLRNNLNFFKKFAISLLINIFIAIAFFYLIPFFGIAPKTNLLIFIIVFGILEFAWRYFFNFFNIRSKSPENVLIITSDQKNDLPEKLDEFLKIHAQFGFQIKLKIHENELTNAENLSQIILKNNIKLIVIPAHLTEKIRLAKLIYKNLPLGIRVLNLSEFYENIFQKVPLTELEEAWFLENFIYKTGLYDMGKNILDEIFALIALIIFSPFFLIIFLIGKLTSLGPVIYKQIRIGKNEKEFTLYKFRTMRLDAEKNGAQWSQPGDNRVTKFGKFLRYTHLDELPQLVNVFKGNISFVGPRPERPEFVKELKDQIPYYEIRHLTKPGITGWAQINYRYGASVQDAVEKLQYDIFYIENRSIFLDLLIVLKTLKLFFVNQK